MKQLLLLALTVLIGTGAYAQRTSTIHGRKDLNAASALPNAHLPGTAAKTTALGDSLILFHINSTDTITIYSVTNDSGFVAGMDAYGDKGFAERYDVPGTDSTLQVIGIVTRFGGHINPASTKTVMLAVWSQGPRTVSFRPTIFNNGLPNTLLTNKTVPITQLGISLVDTAVDTAKLNYFATPTTYLSDSFFVGYTVNYTWGSLGGDTIGLYSNQDGDRSAPTYFVSGTDTTINNVNVTQYDDNTWHDNAVENFAIAYNLYVFPVVVVGTGTAVRGITRNELTFFGALPNPAANEVKVKVSLASATDISIELMDMAGRPVSTVSSSNLSAGEHFIPVNISELPAGEYLYLVRTRDGNGVASKLVVAR